MLVGATRDDTIGPAPGQKELADGHRSPNPVPLPPRKGVAGLGTAGGKCWSVLTGLSTLRRFKPRLVSFSPKLK